MKKVKRLVGLCVLVMLGSSLSACVVVPYGYGPHYHDHYYYGRR